MTLPKLLVTSCRVIPKSSSGMLYHVYPMAARTLPTRLVATRGLHHLTSSTSTPMTFFRQHAAPTSPFSTTSSVAAAHEDSQGGKTPIDMYHPQPMRPEFLTPVTPQQLEKLDIGLTKHREPQDWRGKFALSMVKSMRIPADLFFRKKYIHRAVMLETVAGVPRMVGGMLRHLRSLRKLKHDGGWIAHLLHEAENERMHFMTFMKLSQPNILERLLVTAVQGVSFNAFFLLYIVSPKTAHRVVGYLEEEAVISYTQFLQEIDAGRIPNVPAPEIAIEYWNLPKDAKLKEVVLAVRADEAVHRDSNHHFADCIAVGKDDLRTVHKVDQSVWVAAPKGLKKIAQGPPPHGPVQPSA